MHLRPRSGATVALLVALLAATALCAAAATATDCAALGFNSDTLQCSDCARLSSAVGDDSLAADCAACCSSAPVEEARPYVSGMLSLCSWKMGRHPEVKSFIQSGAAQLLSPRLRVEYVRGLDPTLVMRRRDGADETVVVTGWTKANFEEFFEAKLVTQEEAEKIEQEQLQQQHVKTEL